MKHKKIIVITVAAAACLLLLAFAYPVFNYIAENTDFFAGWGSGMTDDHSEILSTDDLTDNNTQEETNSFFWMYTPELEPLTQEQVDACNAAAKLHACGTLENFIASYPEDKRNVAIEVYESVVFISTSRKRPYLGTFNGVIVIATITESMEETSLMIGDHTISFPTAAGIAVYNGGEIKGIVDAYENGWLTDDDVGVISERVEKYYDALYNGGTHEN